MLLTKRNILIILSSMATKSNDWKSYLVQLEDVLELYLVKKVPALPENVKELIVKVAPWLTIIGIVLSVPALLAVLGLGAFVAPFAGMMGPGVAFAYGMNYFVSMAILAVALVLEALAVPGLLSRSKKGWTLVFYATLVSLVSNLVNLNFVMGLVGALIGWYFLFQVKSHYK